MKWLKNLESLAKNKDTDRCPFCKSSNTDYSVNVCDKQTMMGYGVIWCNDCKKALHISRIKITEEMNTKPIPTDLIY